MQEKVSRFLIVAGALVAAGLPFALAFPKTLLEKLIAVTALVLGAAGISAAIGALRKKQ
jgi:hypothetical protein